MFHVAARCAPQSVNSTLILALDARQVFIKLRVVLGRGGAPLSEQSQGRAGKALSACKISREFSIVRAFRACCLFSPRSGFANQPTLRLW